MNILERGIEFGNKIPREGTETSSAVSLTRVLAVYNLEIRYPERGRKPLFGIKLIIMQFRHLEIRYPERGRKRKHRSCRPIKR